MLEDHVPTPCTGVCTLDPRDKVCLGCFRTGDEIGQWRGVSNTQRREILELAEERRLARQK